MIGYAIQLHLWCGESLVWRAQIKCQKAVKDGVLERPTTCSKCGKVGKVHGHHDDYNKPLEVVWLCPKCHVHLHREQGLDTRYFGGVRKMNPTIDEVKRAESGRQVDPTPPGQRTQDTARSLHRRQSETD